jgi:hypothetical protein
VSPSHPRSARPGRADGSSFGINAPALAGDGNAMVYLALTPDDKAPRGQRAPPQPGRGPGLGVGAAPVGEVAVVRALLWWGRQRVNLSAVEALQLPKAVIGPQQAATIAWQLQRASEVCDGTPTGGVGLFPRGAAGLVRGFPCPDGPVLLWAVDVAALWATNGGLLLDLRDRQIVVLGWRVGAVQLYVRTPLGEVDLTGTIATELLSWLAPGLDEVAVRDISLRSAFAGLFVGAVDRSRAAAMAGLSMLSWHDVGH